jgi:hypothetical protein
MDFSTLVSCPQSDWASLTDSIDFDFVDPRPEEKKEEDEQYRTQRDKERSVREAAWQAKVDKAKADGLEAPEKPADPEESPVRPDWTQSPVEVSALPVRLVPG